jgi:HK97 gp10 family phage protein
MTVKNLERWNAAVAKMAEAPKAAINEVLEKNSGEFADRLRNNIPKESGDLATTIVDAKGPKALSRVVSVGNSEHPYAAALEFGHMDKGVHVPAKPFFFPLLRVMRKKLRSRMRRVIKKAAAACFATAQKPGGDA